MKKRRTMIIALLLVAALALGIGYAGMTGNAIINGNVKNKPHELVLVFSNENGTDPDVKISDSQIDGKDRGVTSSTLVVNDGATFATFNVDDLAHPGDYVTAAVKVKNTNKYDVELLSPTDIITLKTTGLNEDFFDITYAWADEDENKSEAEELILAEGDTQVLYVTITMIGEATGDTLEAGFEITVPARSAS